MYCFRICLNRRISETRGLSLALQENRHADRTIKGAELISTLNRDILHTSSRQSLHYIIPDVPYELR
jgi:hypothetical protein